MNLSDPKSLGAFLFKHDLQPRKGLGQHFLCSSKAVDAILRSASGMAGVLEIGPGPGILTGALSEHFQVIALELDERMISALAESAPTAEVRLVDALTTDLDAILSELPEPRAVVSNLPYYITGALLTRIAEAWRHWDRAVLMMQKEVGERIMAQPGNSDRGSLSVYLESRFDIARVCSVPPGAFIPPPKVDSSVLLFTPKGSEPSRVQDRIVRAGFTQPRKTLLNNLLGGLGVPREVLEKALKASELDPRIRPHMMTLAEWSRVSNELGGMLA